MGLDTTHDCWHGPYSSFNRFRFDLAKQIDINLYRYMGYNDNGILKLDSIKHDIMPLLNHSDCDGKLTIRECRRIVKGLNSILENLNENIEFYDIFKEKIIQFRDGCLNAIGKKEQVYFQ